LYPFGKSDVSPFYTIHDEDFLEFGYTMQAGNGPERMFSQLRSRNLLLIGCNFADWLSRFFMRLSNSERLSSDQRNKKEFFVGRETAEDSDFTVFLECFNQDSRYYPVDARTFVAELHQRWSERNPALSATPEAITDQPAKPAEASSPGAIFISYSSDDVGAARRLYADLQDLGGDVAWFDKTALKPGDDWNQRLRSAVQRCSLFLTLLSANRMVRGGSWNDSPERLRSASRNGGTGDDRTYDHVGFRVARALVSGGSLL
jgi:hypothetical protein